MNPSQKLGELVQKFLESREPPLIAALCGWADTGKSTIAHRTCAALNQLGISSNVISTDSFMKDREERHALGLSGYARASIDAHALDIAISRFVSGEKFEHYPYDNSTGRKQDSPRSVEPCQVLIVEGIHSFHPSIADRMHLRCFISSDEATLRHLRHRANMQKRGMNSIDAKARIDNEWHDYANLVRSLIHPADHVFHVDGNFNYR